MISEKKLLCAFIYSAYESGYCGLRLGKDEKERHKQLYLDYILRGRHYPKEELAATQPEMVEASNIMGIRGYIYRGHFDVVVNRIEEETGNKLSRDSGKLLKATAMSCPGWMYIVMKTTEKGVIARNLVTHRERELVVLEGLEKPEIGDHVSGHWNIFLEIVNDLSQLDEYIERGKRHASLLGLL